MRSDRRHPETGVVHLCYWRQGIDVTGKLRPTVEGPVCRTWAASTGAVVEAPHCLHRQRGIARMPDAELPLIEVVQCARDHRKSTGIDEWRLKSCRANFTC